MKKSSAFALLTIFGVMTSSLMAEGILNLRIYHDRTSQLIDQSVKGLS